MIKWLKKLFGIKSPSTYFVPEDHTIMDNDFSDVEFEVEQKTNEVATIEVRDLKSYIVDEFEQRKTMEKVIETKDLQLEEMSDYKHKHDSALVVIDEYERRIKHKDAQHKKLHGDIADLKNKIDDENEKYNTARIKLNQLTIKYEQCVNELREITESLEERVEKLYNSEVSNEVGRIVEQIENIMTNRVNWHKGHLTKTKMHEYINEAVEKHRGETDESLEV